ncbi:hypothetical protein ACH5RR_026357 [Cinchona calisaya]|uniref:Uncharacterized protein n=1 Tax=Cinchona calisaya TaxID=153742 RepID=A0ABD2Z5M8_9GENT
MIKLSFYAPEIDQGVWTVLSYHCKFLNRISQKLDILTLRMNEIHLVNIKRSPKDPKPPSRHCTNGINETDDEEENDEESGPSGNGGEASTSGGDGDETRIFGRA